MGVISESEEADIKEGLRKKMETSFTETGSVATEESEDDDVVTGLF